MPYLHWETDRMRDRMSRFTQAELHNYRLQKERELEDDLRHRRVARSRSYMIFENNRPDTQKQPSSSAGGEDGSSRVYIGQDTVRPTVPNKLGQYLLDAAKLYEAMAAFRDQHILKKYLFNYPPLHPRRTLDQSYYWTLRSTDRRDCDQVVYRWTKEEQIARLVMVDQLWMWVLDEKTIMTFFPNRYGLHQPDLSDVHQSICLRLDPGRKDQIRSVFDLALVILEECTDVLFNRSKAYVS